MRVPINQIGKSTKLTWQTTSGIESDENKPATSRRFEQIFCAVLISIIFAIVAVVGSLITVL
jgi:hypothetical protein